MTSFVKPWTQCGKSSGIREQLRGRHSKVPSNYERLPARNTATSTVYIASLKPLLPLSLATPHNPKRRIQLTPSVTTLGSTIKAAIAAVSKALPRNSPNQAFNLVVLRFDVRSGPYLHATNGHQTASAKLSESCCSSDSGVDPVILLNDACLKCLGTARDDEDVTISVAHKATKRQETFDEHLPTQRTVDYFCDAVSITLERSRYRFDVRCYDVLPPNTVEWYNCVEFQRADFDQMVQLLGGVSDEHEARFNMSGIHITGITEASIEATATDGRRIGVGAFLASRVGDIAWHTPVIPRALLKIAKSIDSDANVLVTFTDRSCFIRIGDITCEGLLASGRFPDTSGTLARMGREGVHVGDFSRTDVVYGLKMTSITTNRQLDAVGVRVAGKNGKIRFSSKAPDRGQSWVVAVAGLKADFSIMVDPTFLIPILTALQEDTISVHVLDDTALQISTSKFRYVVMGIQL